MASKLPVCFCGESLLTGKCKECLEKSLLHFVSLHGDNVDERSTPYSEWVQRRWRCGVFPYGRVMMTRADADVDVLMPHVADGSDGPAPVRNINFGSQDYLGLGQSRRIEEIAIEAIRQYGIHSAGSPAFIGRTKPVTEIEKFIAMVLGKETSLIYPTGWAAGYGVISGLVRSKDAIVMDALAHSCLQEGAARSTPNVTKFQHNNLEDLESSLIAARTNNRENGLFVIVESLYSMDADGPSVRRVVEIARAHRAIVILDVAHDFGSMGDNGLGALEGMKPEEYPDVIMGSFSKTFAANGGFVACSSVTKDYLYYYSSPHLFSNAIAPVQAAVARECLKIVFEEKEGRELRQTLFNKARLLRQEMAAIGCEVAGKESPIVPVYVGKEHEARIISKFIGDEGILANLVEFPAVPRGKARFRFQLMTTHPDESLIKAAQVFARAKARARELLGQVAAAQADETAPAQA